MVIFGVTLRARQYNEIYEFGRIQGDNRHDHLKSAKPVLRNVTLILRTIGRSPIVTSHHTILQENYYEAFSGRLPCHPLFFDR